MHITYCEEEHAVHSKGGVTRVEGQSEEENKRINKTNNKMKFRSGSFLLAVCAASCQSEHWNIFLPGLCDVLKAASAVDQLHVTHADLGSAHRQEIGSGAADGVLGQVGQ